MNYIFTDELEPYIQQPMEVKRPTIDRMESSGDEPELSIKEEIEDEWESTGVGSNLSAFYSPVSNQTSQPVTVLTNLQRGNIQTQITTLGPDEVTFHTKAAMGELLPCDFNGPHSIDDVDNNGLTALMWASSYGQLPTVENILKRNPIVDFEGPDGETALLLAASNGHHEVVKELLKAGANPNHEDHMCFTALMFAAYENRHHCVDELLKYGADMTMESLADTNAYSIAVNRGSKQAQIVMESFMLKHVHPS